LNKQQYNLRLPPFLLMSLDLYAKEKEITTTTIIEVAIKDFLEKNKNEIKSKELKRIIDFVNMDKAREQTKQEMKRAMFIHNAKKRLSRIMKDGVYCSIQFEQLIKTWVEEAEANGVSPEIFLKEIRKTIGGML